MTILTVQYSDSNNNSILVTHDTGEVWNLPWPISTWHAEEIQEWLNQGNTIAPANVPTLSSVKLSEKTRIDDAATRARYRYISPNKDATYVLKGQQVDAYVAASYPADLTGYGYIDAEITALGLDPTLLADRQTAATNIVNTRDSWLLLDVSIEKQALTGKANINAALDSANVVIAADAAIALLDVI